MEKLVSCCGVICSSCQYFPDTCKGCDVIEGKAFWLEYTGEVICSIYDCCIRIKELKHCGKCTKVPCHRFDGNDPTKTEAENKKDFDIQLAMLKSMKD